MIDFISVVHAAEETNEATKSTNVVELLGINWKLFIAQLINFGVILLVLWKWVLTPLTNALKSRAQKIDESLKEAEKIKEQMAGLEIFKNEQKELAKKDYAEVLHQATTQAAAMRQETLTEAKKQASALMTDAEARIKVEERKMIAEVKTELADLVISATERIIAEKLDKNKDAALISESLKQVEQKE
ncbi:MAG: ATP synthase F0 subunit B [Candidatus Jacksonbacteria bacterium RIFOXYA2_FULL_43_12]|nr:MAG: ATP synthase F0 subunit B [Candidatus Jacksonbacteria bacterium RIFOXYA2_FULL_43_12]